MKVLCCIFYISKTYFQINSDLISIRKYNNCSLVFFVSSHAPTGYKT